MSFFLEGDVVHNCMDCILFPTEKKIKTSHTKWVDYSGVDSEILNGFWNKYISDVIKQVNGVSYIVV